jgi:tetratricopeptide (TPR) repeat protein
MTTHRDVTQRSHDWHPRTAWTAEDQRGFFTRAKLARMRTQYLLIQASSLANTRTADLATAALTLMDIALSERPDLFYLSNVYLTRAECFVHLGRLEDAVAAFREALQARRALPNVINYAYLEFAWTVARFGMTVYYGEVLDALREFQQSRDLRFPVNAYRYFGALALIAEDRGDHADGRASALQALRAISEDTGPFSRHPDLGVVDAAHVARQAHDRLQQLAAV